MSLAVLVRHLRFTRTLILALGACAFGFSAPPKVAPTRDPLAILRPQIPAADRTQVMVLGTLHLAREKVASSAPLTSLLARLATWKPDLIAVEVLPGDRIHELELRGQATLMHKEVLEGFTGQQRKTGELARGQLGIDAVQAAQELLDPTKSQPPARRVLLQLASYDLMNALLGWSRLEPEGRKAIPGTLGGLLDRILARPDETNLIALALARTLDLPEVASVDAFEDALSIETVFPAWIRSNKAVSKADPAPTRFRRHERSLKDEALKAGDLLPYYRHLNSEAYAQGDVDEQWGAYLRSHFVDRSDRGRLGLWEERNLKIAANIRALAARNPGKRILVIYGAAHKPFLDAYLATASDLTVRQPESILR